MSFKRCDPGACITDVRVRMMSSMGVLDQTWPKLRQVPPASCPAIVVGESANWKACLAAVNAVTYNAGGADQVSPRQILVPVDGGRTTFVGLVVRSLSGEQLDRGVLAAHFRHPCLKPVDDGVQDWGFSHAGSMIHVFLLDGGRRGLELWVKSGVQGGYMGKVELLVNPWISR